MYYSCKLWQGIYSMILTLYIAKTFNYLWYKTTIIILIALMIVKSQSLPVSQLFAVICLVLPCEWAIFFRRSSSRIFLHSVTLALRAWRKQLNTDTVGTIITRNPPIMDPYTSCIWYRTILYWSLYSANTIGISEKRIKEIDYPDVSIIWRLHRHS